MPSWRHLRRWLLYSSPIPEMLALLDADSDIQRVIVYEHHSSFVPKFDQYWIVQRGPHAGAMWKRPVQRGNRSPGQQEVATSPDVEGSISRIGDAFNDSNFWTLPRSIPQTDWCMDGASFLIAAADARHRRTLTGGDDMAESAPATILIRTIERELKAVGLLEHDPAMPDSMRTIIITDDGGLPIHGASVEAVSASGNHGKYHTRIDGTVILPELPPFPEWLSVEKADFESIYGPFPTEWPHRVTMKKAPAGHDRNEIDLDSSLA